MFFLGLTFLRGCLSWLAGHLWWLSWFKSWAQSSCLLWFVFLLFSSRPCSKWPVNSHAGDRTSLLLQQCMDIWHWEAQQVCQHKLISARNCGVFIKRPIIWTINKFYIFWLKKKFTPSITCTQNYQYRNYPNTTGSGFTRGEGGVALYMWCRQSGYMGKTDTPPVCCRDIKV